MQLLVEARMTTRSSIMAASKTQRGQALVEFIIFLPFMLMMYTVVVSLGDAIHGSINQQKVTRSYFYYRLQNNSQISKPQRNGSTLFNDEWTSFGHTFIGWADYLDGKTPFLPCYKLNLPFAPAVGTVYGLCGATMQKQDGEFLELPTTEQTDPVILISSCWIL
jgi:hypothetical protein